MAKKKPKSWDQYTRTAAVSDVAGAIAGSVGGAVVHQPVFEAGLLTSIGSSIYETVKPMLEALF